MYIGRTSSNCHVYLTINFRRLQYPHHPEVRRLLTCHRKNPHYFVPTLTFRGKAGQWEHHGQPVRRRAGVRHRTIRAKVHFRHLRHEKRQDRQATHGGKVRLQRQKPARMYHYQGLEVGNIRRRNGKNLRKRTSSNIGKWKA